MKYTRSGEIMASENDVVVVPLVPVEGEQNTEDLLRRVLNREALLINRVAAPEKVVPSNMVAQTSGTFAKAISQVVGQSGRMASSSDLYRVVLPTGSVARDLIPAIGGGFRGMVRSSGSTNIAAHARLLPAAAGTGATLAAGPLIAAVGLAVAGEMIAQHQINKKLIAIEQTVKSLNVRIAREERATLTTATQQAEKVASYLLDQAQIPSISSASHAFGQLDSLTNTYIERLDRWRDIAESYEGKSRVKAATLMNALVETRENQVQEFEQMVFQTYEALALRARVVILEKVAAEFTNANRSLTHVESVLRNELSELASRQKQLTNLLEDLNVLEVDALSGPVVVAGKGTIRARASFGRLVRALHSAPDSIPILNDSDQTVIELAPVSEGLAVVTPS